MFWTNNSEVRLLIARHMVRGLLIILCALIFWLGSSLSSLFAQDISVITDIGELLGLNGLEIDQLDQTGVIGTKPTGSRII